MSNNYSKQRLPVSVIIPVYNAERYLAEALTSVLTQEYAPLEIIVIDDGSTDGGAQIIHALAETSSIPVRYAYRQNSGPAAARNYGLDLARGELIAFQDADDVWMPDKLSVQGAYLEANPTVQYAICQVRFFLEAGCRVPAGFRAEWLAGEPVAYLMQAMVVRRQVFERIGRFDPALSPADDADWFARAFDADVPGYVVPRVLLRKRVHNANISLVTPDNNQLLLTALRRSVLRKRRKGVSNESCSG